MSEQCKYQKRFLGQASNRMGQSGKKPIDKVLMENDPLLKLGKANEVGVYVRAFTQSEGESGKTLWYNRVRSLTSAY